jgi:hypothetical protein
MVSNFLAENHFRRMVFLAESELAQLMFAAW